MSCAGASEATPATALLPVVMITASSGEEKLKALEPGQTTSS